MSIETGERVAESGGLGNSIGDDRSEWGIGVDKTERGDIVLLGVGDGGESDGGMVGRDGVSGIKKGKGSSGKGVIEVSSGHITMSSVVDGGELGG